MTSVGDLMDVLFGGEDMRASVTGLSRFEIKIFSFRTATLN
jgi:hypothetical protein